MRRWAWSRWPVSHRQPPHYGCGVLLIELRRQGPRVFLHLGKFHRQRAAGAQGRSRTDGLSHRGRPRYPAAPLGLGRAYSFIWENSDLDARPVLPFGFGPKLNGSLAVTSTCWAGGLRTGRVSRTPACGFGDRRPAVGPDPYRPPATRLQAEHLRGGHGASLAEAHQSPRPVATALPCDCARQVPGEGFGPSVSASKARRVAGYAIREWTPHESNVAPAAQQGRWSAYTDAQVGTARLERATSRLSNGCSAD